MSCLSIALLGVGGWGWVYVDALLDEAHEHQCRFVAAIDPQPSGCKRLGELRARQVPLFRSLDEFYANNHADLVVIASPIHLHAEHVCTALQNSSHVLCEKPTACSISDVARIIAARERAQKHLAIGYQWSFSQPIQRLKRDIAAGRFGAPVRFRTLVQWPRGEDYYSRNQWAGRRVADNGAPVLDSPLNNACAHFLHNAFYVLPEVFPTELQAELYRANPIQNFDTAVMRCDTTVGASMIFCVSHAARSTRDPMLSYEFEHATIDYGAAGQNRLVARFGEHRIDYGDPSAETFAKKLWDTVSAIREGADTLCSAESSAIHTAIMGAVHHSTPNVASVPENQIEMQGTPGHQIATIKGLDELLMRCYREHQLPAELGVSWAVPACCVRVEKTSILRSRRLTAAAK